MIFTGTGNANKILGIPVQTGTPSDTFTLLYDAASSRWIFGPSGTPPAGGVGGGANLTTVGSVPFVTSSGVLGQSGNLFWDNANARLNLGSTVRANGQVLNMYESGNIRYGIGVATSALRFYNPGAGNNTVFGTVSVADGSTFAEQMRLVGGTGNLLLGTTTDGNFRLDVASSGSSGTTRIYDQTPTTGSTSLVVRAGAGQGSTATLQFQNSAGTEVAKVWNSGRFEVASVFSYSATNGFGMDGVIFNFSNNIRFLWSSDSSRDGPKDLALSRASANTLQVGDGGANANGIIRAAGVETFGGYFALLNAGGTLNEVLIQSNVDLASSRLLRFSSTTNANGTKDLALSRASANVLQVGDGGSNSNGIILSRRVQSAGETVASLPAAAAGNAGTISYVTDSNSTTIGATVAGGGANKVLVWSNGTAWKIFAN